MTDGSDVTAKNKGRAGEATGKYKDWINIEHFGERSSMDLWPVSSWEYVNQEEILNTNISHQETAAKLSELKNW